MDCGGLADATAWSLTRSRLLHGLPYSALRHYRSAGIMYPSAARYGLIPCNEGIG